MGTLQGPKKARRVEAILITLLVCGVLSLHWRNYSKLEPKATNARQEHVTEENELSCSLEIQQHIASSLGHYSCSNRL